MGKAEGMMIEPIEPGKVVIFVMGCLWMLSQPIYADLVELYDLIGVFVDVYNDDYMDETKRTIWSGEPHLNISFEVEVSNPTVVARNPSYKYLVTPL